MVVVPEVLLRVKRSVFVVEHHTFIRWSRGGRRFRPLLFFSPPPRKVALDHLLELSGLFYLLLHELTLFFFVPFLDLWMNFLLLKVVYHVFLLFSLLSLNRLSLLLNHMVEMISGVRRWHHSIPRLRLKTLSQSECLLAVEWLHLVRRLSLQIIEGVVVRPILNFRLLYWFCVLTNRGGHRHLEIYIWLGFHPFFKIAIFRISHLSIMEHAVVFFIGKPVLAVRTVFPIYVVVWLVRTPHRLFQVDHLFVLGRVSVIRVAEPISLRVKIVISKWGRVRGVCHPVKT